MAYGWIQTGSDSCRVAQPVLSPQVINSWSRLSAVNLITILITAPLLFMPPSVNAGIQPSDFCVHEDGGTAFIDGVCGAPIHIDYIGSDLSHSLSVTIRFTNPRLKTSTSSCTFTHARHNCCSFVQLRNQVHKVFGVNQFELTPLTFGGEDQQSHALRRNAATESGSSRFWWESRLGLKGSRT